MTLKINYIDKLSKTSSTNLAIFVEERVNTKLLANFFSKNQISYIEQMLKKKTFEKKINIFDLDIKKSIIFITLSKNSNYQNLGANFYDFLKNNNLNNISILFESISNLNKNSVNNFLHGIKLKSYEFNLYKSKIKKYNLELNVVSNIKDIKKSEIKYTAIESGIYFARDLVSEPPNVLYPKEYVNRLLKLKKLGIKVTVYDEKKLHQLGMHSLLGVGRGSSKESFLVTLEWYGDKKNKNSPLSFVGKGVCFDTGGISLKPAKFMEEMKYDMAISY